MNFNDLILDVFKNEKEDEENLTEQGLLITPFLAFSAFKKKAFDKVKKSFKDVKDSPISIRKEAKAKAATAKEKAKAALGATSGKGGDATVYKLTKEQLDVMSDIYSKYGKDIVKEILQFRKNILAPYQIIKREVKKSSRVTAKDVTGMTKEQFKSALESGRKKIEKRGEDFFNNSQELQDRLKRLNDQLNALKEAEDDFKNGKSLSPNISNKLFKQFGVGTKDLEGYSPEELRNAYNEIEKNYHDIIAQLDKARGGESEPEKSLSMVQKQRELRGGKSLDLTKTEHDEFYKKGDFNSALGRYFFRRDILDKLKPGKSNIFRDTYLSIIKEMRDRIKKQKDEAMKKLVNMRKTVEFNDKEAAIWKKRPTVKSFSGNLDDYYQEISEKDFPEGVKYIERSDKLKDAEQKIENEIKKFERKLKKILSPEDYQKLKKYRLINNLISVKELEDPSNLFKSSDELNKQRLVSTANKEEQQKEKQNKEYISPDEFERRIKEIATMEFDSSTELNNAKDEAKDLADQMKQQGDDEEVKKYSDILRAIRERRSTKKQSLKGHDYDRSLIVDINDIEKLARKIINTDYSSVDKAKQDKQRLDNMIKSYKENNEDADRNLKEINFLMDRVALKLGREVK